METEAPQAKPQPTGTATVKRQLLQPDVGPCIYFPAAGSTDAGLFAATDSNTYNPPYSRAPTLTVCEIVNSLLTSAPPPPMSRQRRHCGITFGYQLATNHLRGTSGVKGGLSYLLLRP